MFYFHLFHMHCAVQDCCVAFSHLAKFEVVCISEEGFRTPELEPNRAISEDRTLPVF